MSLPHAESLPLSDLVAPTPGHIATRVLAKEQGGSVTLFAFDAGQRLAEHTSPLEALVIVLEGSFSLTVGGTPVEAAAGSVVRLPAGVPHSLAVSAPARMLLITLKRN